MRHLDILGPMGMIITFSGSLLYLINRVPCQRPPLVQREKLTLKQKQTLVDRIGFPLYSSLEPGKLVVTGSTILDIIDDTNYAKDIDLFGTEDACAKVVYMLRSRGGKVEEESNYEGTTLRHVVRQDRLPDVDVVVCSNIDSTVSAFDLSRCKVYYDGVNLVKLDNWNENKNKTVVEDKTATEIYRGMTSREGDRIRKYKDRGYGFLDKDGNRVDL